MESNAYYQSPIGIIKLTANDRALIHCDFVEQTSSENNLRHPILDIALTELQAFFAGKLFRFSVPLVPQGTAFRLRVWQALQQIPYGQTVAYGDIAKTIGMPTASRAIGQANHHNPISIMIPCHRVIGKNGNLTGYGAGIWRKQWLLTHEQRYVPQSFNH